MGLVPIVEPDVSLSGAHTLEAAVAINTKIQAVLYRAMLEHGVFMEGHAAAGSTLAVYPGLVIRDMRTVDELTYGVVSSPPAVHYIASIPDAHASTIRWWWWWWWW